MTKKILKKLRKNVKETFVISKGVIKHELLGSKKLVKPKLGFRRKTLKEITKSRPKQKINIRNLYQ